MSFDFFFKQMARYYDSTTQKDWNGKKNPTNQPTYFTQQDTGPTKRLIIHHQRIYPLLSR